MLKKFFKVCLIIVIIILNIYIQSDNILLVSRKDKKNIIRLHNLPSDSKILLVKGRHTTLSNSWPIIVYYKSNSNIYKKTLNEGSYEGDEISVLAVSLHQNKLVNIVYTFEILLIFLYLMKKLVNRF